MPRRTDRRSAAHVARHARALSRLGVDDERRGCLAQSDAVGGDGNIGDEARGIEKLLDTASVRRLRELLGERSDAMVAVGSPSGDLLWATAPGSVELFGHGPAELQGRSRFDFIHPQDVDAVRRKHEQAVHGQTVRCYFRCGDGAGGWRRLSTVAWPVQTDDGPLIVSVTVPVQDE